jgi:lipopolysaccharide transport system permease protein
MTAQPASQTSSLDPGPAGVEVIIRPREGWIGIDWSELWRYRELLYFLAWRDIKVRYKQAMLGFMWAVLSPLIQVAIYTLIFGRAGGFARQMPEGVPYSAFIFAGLIPWLVISQAISGGGMSLVSHQHLLTKIYLPRLFIPASSIGCSLVDMCISYVVLALMMLAYGVTPAWTIVFLPLLILLTIIAAVGIALAVSSLTILYRDLRFVLPFLVQLLMLVSAVAFPSSVLRAYPWLIYLNPIAAIIDAYRAAMFHGWSMSGSPPHPNPWHLAYAVSFVIVLFLLGLYQFRRTERRFADIV